MVAVYLDACTIVYLVEGAEPFHGQVVSALKALTAEAAVPVMTSRLSVLECKVGPLRSKDLPLLSAYDAFFSSEAVSVADIDGGIIEKAALLRATYGFRTPDAIHLATAIEKKAAVFLTGDGALKRCSEVTVSVLD